MFEDKFLELLEVLEHLPPSLVATPELRVRNNVGRKSNHALLHINLEFSVVTLDSLIPFFHHSHCETNHNLRETLHNEHEHDSQGV